MGDDMITVKKADLVALIELYRGAYFSYLGESSIEYEEDCAAFDREKIAPLLRKFGIIDG